MTPIFQQYGDRLRFTDQDDLRNKLSRLDLDEGRDRETTAFRERYTIAKYLRILDGVSRLRFPLTVQKEEHPDFILTNSEGRSFGMEVTEGTTQEYRKGMAQSSRFVFLDQFSEHPNPRGGWYGHQAEKEWAGIIAKTIVDKTHSLNKGHYLPADWHELLIYSNTNLPNLEEENGYGEVREFFDAGVKHALLGTDLGTYFRRINIVYGDDLFWLVDYR